MQFFNRMYISKGLNSCKNNYSALIFEPTQDIVVINILQKHHKNGTNKQVFGKQGVDA